MKHHGRGGGVIGVGVGLDGHGGQLSALVVVAGQRLWVALVAAPESLAVAMGSVWGRAGGGGVGRGSGARRAGSNPGTEVTGWLCTALPLRVPVRAFSEDT
jgi:hypothetical protein